MDCHSSLPRIECLAAAAVMRRVGPIPDPARPDDYERVLRPVNGLGFGLAQSGAMRIGGASRPSEQAWRWIAGDSHPRGRRLLASALARSGVPAAVWSLNKILRSDFHGELTAGSISRAGIAGGIEMVRRLRIEAAHVIIGHTHRVGPRPGEDPWSLPAGGSLHNTGNWVFASAMHGPRARPGPYWPGTVTWLEEAGPPRQVGLLADRSSNELGEIARGGRFRLAALASRELG
jgi:hypothetical protein